jgi:hypothetical protein
MEKKSCMGTLNQLSLFFSLEGVYTNDQNSQIFSLMITTPRCFAILEDLG